MSQGFAGFCAPGPVPTHPPHSPAFPPTSMVVLTRLQGSGRTICVMEQPHDAELAARLAKLEARRRAAQAAQSTTQSNGS